MHYHSFLFSVMCKCSYLNEEELKNRHNRVVLPSSTSSSQVTTPENPTSPSSSSTSQRKISTTFFSSPRSSPRRGGGGANTPTFSFSSPRRSQALESRSIAWGVKDEAKSGGTTPRTIFLPQLKRGKLKRRVTIGSTLSTSSGGSGDFEEPDWPPFADEDYIVFCFEEDGAFHVVMEESPKTITRKLQCHEHGNVSCECGDEKKDINHFKSINSPRRDCLLPNKEAEEEMSNSQLSPKLQQHGTDIVDHLSENNKFVIENELTESMECRNGSVESTDSSQLDDEEQFQNEQNPEVELSSFPWNLIDHDDNDDNVLPAFRRGFLFPNTQVDEEEEYLSPKGQMAVMVRMDELLKGDNDESSIVSDESSGFSESESRDERDDQLVKLNEEVSSESAKSSISNHSIRSSTSFRFPVLEWDWVGSPVKWQRSGRIQFRRHKSRPACLRCCKF